MQAVIMPGVCRRARAHLRGHGGKDGAQQRGALRAALVGLQRAGQHGRAREQGVRHAVQRLRIGMHKRLRRHAQT
jgi:hypothetical protein